MTNTIVLLASSFLVATAIRLARVGRMRGAAASIVGAIGLGALFLTLKLYEWHVHASEGFVPGSSLYFTLYYLMTGLHAVHLAVGMLVMAWIARAIASGRVSRHRHLPLDSAGLYWHFVDVVWLFLWPLFYLVHS